MTEREPFHDADWVLFGGPEEASIIRYIGMYFDEELAKAMTRSYLTRHPKGYVMLAKQRSVFYNLPAEPEELVF